MPWYLSKDFILPLRIGPHKLNMMKIEIISTVNFSKHIELLTLNPLLGKSTNAALGTLGLDISSD